MKKVEVTKQNALAIEQELQDEIKAEIAAFLEYESVLAKKIKEIRLVLENWDVERQKLLARIKELEDQILETKAEMRMKLDVAEKEKEKALAMSDAELRRLLEAAEREKNQALDKVRLLLSGNQKQGYLFHAGLLF